MVSKKKKRECKIKNGRVYCKNKKGKFVPVKISANAKDRNKSMAVSRALGKLRSMAVC